MKAQIVACLALSLICSSAYSAASRWDTSLSMGRDSAFAEANDGSLFGIYCGTGTGKHEIGIYLRPKNVSVRGSVPARVIVDAKTYPILLRDGNEESTGGNDEPINRVAAALAGARSKMFLVELPSRHVKFIFPTSNAAAILLDWPDEKAHKKTLLTRSCIDSR